MLSFRSRVCAVSKSLSSARLPHVCKCTVEGKMLETAADMDVECFGERIEVAVERTAQALQRRVVGFFQVQVDGMGHI